MSAGIHRRIGGSIGYTSAGPNKAKVAYISTDYRHSRRQTTDYTQSLSHLWRIRRWWDVQGSLESHKAMAATYRLLPLVLDFNGAINTGHVSATCATNSILSASPTCVSLVDNQLPIFQPFRPFDSAPSYLDIGMTCCSNSDPDPFFASSLERWPSLQEVFGKATPCASKKLLLLRPRRNRIRHSGPDCLDGSRG